MTERPSGVVTFLFSDIEGSTRLLRELGSEHYGSLLDDHRRILRHHFVRQGGHEEGTEGDSFLIAFASPLGAVTAASDAQTALDAHQWPPGSRVHVRMGIHSGEARATPDGYVGVAVHRGARIAAAAHGDQVLVSQATVDLLKDVELPYRLVDLGSHLLKDFEEPQHIFQLEQQSGATRRFPALRTVSSRLTNLPTQPTALIGREAELRDLKELLRDADVRLVTLTGAGGTGKTRLALQTAEELLGDFDDGVWFVPLGATPDPELVLPAIGSALALNEAAGQSLGAFLEGKRLLLVIDNFEQVIDAAGAVAEMLAGAPHVKVLVTSREPLRLRIERVNPVPALALPRLESLPDPVELARYASVALFVERATAARPEFTLTDANARAIAGICVRLDGLPLAIELAAARITLLSPDQMLLRLGDSLRLLTGGARDVPARHQTLRATLEWSHDLLTGNEQGLFARLAAFVDRFSIDAAESVCDADLETLSSLLDKSLVRREVDGFAMLETVRDYALERLESSGEAFPVRERHATYFEALVDRVYPERFRAESERSAELEVDAGNLRAALDLFEATEPERALSMAGKLGWFWHAHSHLPEGRARLERLLARCTESNAVRARALAALGEVSGRQADLARAKTALDEAVAIFERLGLEQDRALALHELGWAFFFVGDDSAARPAMEASLLSQRSLGDELLINRAQLGLLQVLVAIGEVDTVEPLALQSLAAAQGLGDKRGEQLAQHFLADSLLIRGEPAAAGERYRASLRAATLLGDRIEIVFEVQGVAMSLAGVGRREQAVRLASAAQADLDALGLDISAVVFWNALLERYVGAARDALGSDAAAVVKAGRSIGMEAAVAEALEGDFVSDSE